MILRRTIGAIVAQVGEQRIHNRYRQIIAVLALCRQKRGIGETEICYLRILVYIGLPRLLHRNVNEFDKTIRLLAPFKLVFSPKVLPGIGTTFARRFDVQTSMRIKECYPRAGFSKSTGIAIVFHCRNGQHLSPVIRVRILHKLPIACGKGDIADVICPIRFLHDSAYFGMGLFERHSRHVRDDPLMLGIPHLNGHHVRMILAIVADDHAVRCDPFRLGQCMVRATL